MGRAILAGGRQQGDGQQAQPAREGGCGEEGDERGGDAHPQQGCQRRPARQQGEAERHAAIGPDAAVAHDLELALDGPPAAKAIGHIRQPILMEGAGGGRQRHQREHGGQFWRQHDARARHQSACGQGDQQPRDGRKPHRPAEIAHGMGRGLEPENRQRQPRVESQAKEQIAEEAHGP